MQRNQDVHESIWSWRLFWGQLKALLLALWARLFARKRVAAEAPSSVDCEIGGEPTARDMQAIYRALLKWAANLGYPHKKDETPYEFEQRLD